MYKISEDIQEAMLLLSKKSRKSIFVLIDRLYDIIETDETIKTLGDIEHKVRYGWALLYKENN